MAAKSMAARLAASSPHLQRFPPRPSQPWRPAVTLAYAQSLDGCIAAARGAPTRLSGAESMRLTHELRALHEAILVGVGTVLADDPQLSTRLASGPSPRPIVLDSRLRTPLSARLLRRPDGAPRGAIIVCSAAQAGSERAAALRAAGALVLPVAPAGAPTQAWRAAPDRTAAECPAAEAAPAPRGDAPLDLREVLVALAAHSVRSVMVEGGGHVLRSFLAGGAALFDELCVTTAPLLLAGGPRFGADGGPGGGALAAPSTRLELTRAAYAQVGEDMVLFASPAWAAVQPPRPCDEVAAIGPDEVDGGRRMTSGQAARQHTTTTSVR